MVYIRSPGQPELHSEPSVSNKEREGEKGGEAERKLDRGGVGWEVRRDE